MFTTASHPPLPATITPYQYLDTNLSSGAAHPKSQKWLVDGFCWYSKGMIRKCFTSFGINGTERVRSITETQPLIVYANHASWWDPIVAMLARKEAMPMRTLYAPIDSEMLENYAVLKKMGFYGVKLESYAGAQQFLVHSKTILERPNASIWITPEGKFCDVRDHTQSLMPGMAHLASRVPGIACVPLAIEYPFWDDSRPHIFCMFGKPVEMSPNEAKDKEAWSTVLTRALRKTQADLAANVMLRDPKAFEYIVESRAKKLGWYDHARSMTAWIRGKEFDPRHSHAMKKRQK